MPYSTKQKFISWVSELGKDHPKDILWLLALSALLIFIGIGLRSPWPADEPRYALIAKEMVESGQWLFPVRAGELYPDKPPLFFWSIAIFYWLTGSLNIAFLLPSALFGLLTLFLIYDLGRRLWSVQVGFQAAALLALTIQFTLQAKTAQIDMMVCTWITLGCYGLLRFLLDDQKWRWYFMAWFFMGVGVITKGVGFLPMLMLVPYFLLRWLKVPDLASIQAKPEIQRNWRWLTGLPLMLGTILLWLLPMLYSVSVSDDSAFQQYRDNILLKQTVKRYTDAWHHFQPFWYYFVTVIPSLWFPLSFMLPWLVTPWKKAITLGDRRIILPLCWILLVLVFFSFSRGKRGVYIFPTLPMMALIVAPYLKDLLKSRGFNWLLWSVVTLCGLALTTLGGLGIGEHPALAKLSTTYGIDPWGFIITLGVWALVASLLTFRRLKPAAWAIFIIGTWGLYSTWGYRLFNPAKISTPLYQQIASEAPSIREIALVDFTESQVLFSPYPITQFGYHTEPDQQLRAAWQWQNKLTARYVLAPREAVTGEECYVLKNARDVGFAHGKNWVLLGDDARKENCPAPAAEVKAFHYTPDSKATENE